MQKKILSCLVVALLFLPDLSWAGGDDVQHWGAYTLNHKFNDKISMFVYTSMRIKENVSERQYWEVRNGISYKVDEHWDLNLHYLHGESKNSANKWLDEKRVEIQPTYGWKWMGFGFANRFRAEYRIINGVEKWRFRNRVKVSRPVTVWNKKLTVFADEEVFYDEFADKYNQNRASVGFGKKITDNVKLDVYYMHKSDKGAKDWKGENIIGTSLSISI